MLPQICYLHVQISGIIQLIPCKTASRNSSTKHFVIFTGIHLSWYLFFRKVADHQSCNFIKNRLQHIYFLVNIWKFTIIPILKNIWERLFLESILQEHFSDQNLAKGSFDETKMVTCCVKGYSNQERLNKNVSYHKVLGEERKY